MSESKVGDAARDFWGRLKKRTEARVAHARGDITDEQLAAALGPPAPEGTSLGEVLVDAIKKAPEGSFGAMLRKSGKELLAEAAKRVAKKDGPQDGRK